MRVPPSKHRSRAFHRSESALAALVAFALALVACTAAAPALAPVAEPPATAATSAPSAAQSSPTAPETGATQPGTAVPPASTPSPAAEPPPTKEPPTPALQPLTEAEQKESERRCRPLRAAIQKAKGTGKNPLVALEGALKNPPKMSVGDLARCADLLRRGIATYLIAAYEVEATVLMKRMEQAVALSYQEKGALCPSASAVPADKTLVANEGYVSSASDWDTAGWKCLGFSLEAQPQRFQYEVRSDSAARTFELIARGAPAGPDHWIELHQKGSITAKGVSVGSIERR